MTTIQHPTRDGEPAPDRPTGDGGPLLLDAVVTTRCRRRVHLDHDPTAAELPRALPDPAIEQRRADAVTHRETLRVRLAAATGHGWHEVPAGSTAERTAATAALVAAGAPRIWAGQPPVEDGRSGRADLLVRVAGGGYVPVVVVRHRITDPGEGAVTSSLPWLDPAAAGPDPQRRVRPQIRDLMRLAHLYRMLQTAGWGPGPGAPNATVGGVIGLDADVVVWHDLAAGSWPGQRSTLAEYDVRFADRTAVSAAARAMAPALAGPSRISECRRCPWWPSCEAQLTAVDDVSLVVRGEAGAHLRADGVPTVAALAALDPAAPPPPALVGMAYPDLVALARARRAGLAVVRRVPTVPVRRADVEVDVDMESFGESGAYLWGVRLAYPGGRRPGDEAPGYRAFATWDPLPTADEGRSFAEFWTWLSAVRARTADSGRSFAAYCYNEQAENRWLLASARRFAGLPGIPPLAQVQEFIADDGWVDLFAVVNDWFLCANGKGLKKIAPVAGFAWHDPEAGGENSMRWYRAAVGMDGAPPDLDQRARLIEYNADDVTATAVLRAWMDSPRVLAVPLAGQL